MSDIITPGVETWCRMCGQSFDLHVPLPVGKGMLQIPEKERKLAWLVMRMGEHCMKAHKDENRALEFESSNFLSLRRIMTFKTTEPELLSQIDLLRWTCLQWLMTAKLNDEVIAKDAAEVANKFVAESRPMFPALNDGEWQLMKADVERRVKDVMTNYRNMVEEPNKWVKPAEQKPAAEPEKTPV